MRESVVWYTKGPRGGHPPSITPIFIRHCGKLTAGTWKSPVWKGKSSEPNLHDFWGVQNVNLQGMKSMKLSDFKTFFLVGDNLNKMPRMRVWWFSSPIGFTHCQMLWHPIKDCWRSSVGSSNSWVSPTVIPGMKIQLYTPEPNTSPLKNRPGPKRKRVFQPSIFRCDVSLPKGKLVWFQIDIGKINGMTSKMLVRPKMVQYLKDKTDSESNSSSMQKPFVSSTLLVCQ